MVTNELLTELQKQISALQNQVVALRKEIQLITTSKTVSDKWLPRPWVMDFMNYQDTQMAEFEKTDGIIVSKVGRRKFILRTSLEKLIDNSIITDDAIIKS